MNRRALICGGGIAGLALAHWLHRVGIEPVIVERAARFEALGHYIALRGSGVDVIREMGLERACRDREMRYRQLLLMTASGRLLRRGSSAELDEKLGGYILFRRADLQAALFESVRDRVEIRHGCTLTALHDDGSGVECALSSSAGQRFDFVFGADGIHSRTRRLLFGDGFLRPLGGRYVALTVELAHGLAPGSVRSYFGRGQSVILFVTARDHLSAVVYHGDGGDAPIDADTRPSPSEVRTLLQAAYRDFAPEVRAVFDALDERSFVFSDVIGQVRLPSIVKGRAALVGDAAHCPTFMSGMGSALALQGARLLALHLQRQPDDAARALAAYEHDVTPIAQRYQATAIEMRPLLLDRRPWLAQARNLALRLTPEWLMDRKVRRFYDTERWIKRRQSLPT